MEVMIGDHYEIEDISSLPSIQELVQHSVGFKNGFLRINPPGFIYPSEIQNYLERLRKFEVRDDDTWICTFPKCGTTWTQEMVWCLMNNLDFKTAKTIDLDERMIYMEHISVEKEASAETFPDTIKLASEQPSPRIIKTHLPFTMLPDQIKTKEKNPKIVHVSRNSRDVCVSLYHHWKLLEGFKGGFDLWSRLFLEGYSGYYSPFWRHVESYYLSEYDNIIFLKYEEMKKDLRSNINSVTTFLGCKSCTEDEKTQLEEHLSVKNFKNCPTLNKANLVHHLENVLPGSSNSEDGVGFVRKGVVRDWANYFTEEMSAKFLEQDIKLFNQFNPQD